MPYIARLRQDGKYENRKLVSDIEDGYVQVYPQIDGADKLSDGTNVEYYKEVVMTYNGDTLITWALQQGFAADIMQHMAAFLDFANKATDASTANFRAYAGAVGLSSTAETIITKAIELGANIEE